MADEDREKKITRQQKIDSRIGLVHINGYILSHQLRQMANILEVFPSNLPVRLRYTDGQITPEELTEPLIEDGFFENRISEAETLKSLAEVKTKILERSDPPVRKNAARNAGIAKLKAEGYSNVEIGKQFDLTPGAIYAILKNLEKDAEI